MSRDIVDNDSRRLPLVVAGRVEREVTHELAVSRGDHADVAIGDQQHHGEALEPRAHADVQEPRLVAQRELAAPVDLVVADAEVRLDLGAG